MLNAVITAPQAAPSQVMRITPEWKGETCFIVGGGPSLRGFEGESIRGLGRVIAINNSYQLCPFADILYFADGQWYEWHKEHLDAFRGRMITGCVVPIISGARRIRIVPFPGLQTMQDSVAGNNSGYHAINLAYHLGVARIILLGFDMDVERIAAIITNTHWHKGHPDMVTPEKRLEMMKERMLPGFSMLVTPLETAGIEVINANPSSAMTFWPRRPLADVIEQIRKEQACLLPA